MKRYPGMNLMRGVLLVVSLMSAACGGEKSVASKSAEAYREAQAKGIPVGGGHEHGGHAVTSTTAAADQAHSATRAGDASIDHSAHGTSADAHAGMNHGTDVVDHAAMGHGTTPRAGATDHAVMGHGATSRPRAADHATMGHGATPRAGATDHAAIGHGTTTGQPGRTPAVNAHAGHGAAAATMPAAASGQHSGMQHGAQAPAPDPHAQHGTTGTQDPALVAAAPRSSAEIQQVQPVATLIRDAFDAPAPVSVAEATKAAQGSGHEGHQMRGITPGEDRENPPTPMPATRDGSNKASAMDHSQHGAEAKPSAPTVYTCPMHPEVTSDKPGTCPKCGMTLVRKK